MWFNACVKSHLTALSSYIHAMPPTIGQIQIPRLDQPIYFRRRAHLQASQGYGVGRTGLMRRWTVITPGLVARLKINGLEVAHETLDGRTFDLKAIRDDLRDSLDSKSQVIDNTLFGTQLLATEYYRCIPITCLFDHVFTGELCVTFEFESTDGEPVPERVEIEEEYAISDALIQDRIKSGQSLDDIRRDAQQSIRQEL